MTVILPSVICAITWRFFCAPILPFPERVSVAEASKPADDPTDPLTGTSNEKLPPFLEIVITVLLFPSGRYFSYPFLSASELPSSDASIVSISTAVDSAS